MIIRNLLNAKIDLSEDTLHMAVVIGPLKEIEIDDRYRRLKNIDAALANNWIEIVSYDGSATSTVVHPEITGSGGDIISSTLTLDDGESGTLDEVDTSTTKTAKWFVNVVDNTNNRCQSLEIYAHHEGGSAVHTTYAKIGKASVGFDVDVSGGNMRLRATASDDSQVIRAQRISITI